MGDWIRPGRPSSLTLPIRLPEVPRQVTAPKPNLVSGREAYDERFWQDGIVGDHRTGANIVTYNGEDVRGVMRINDTNTRHRVIRAHNEVVRKMIAAEKR